MNLNLISFDVHMLDKDDQPVVITLPIGPALEVVAHCQNAVVKLVPNYGLPSLPENSDKE